MVTTTSAATAASPAPLRRQAASWPGDPILGALRQLRSDQFGTLDRMAEAGSPVAFRVLNQRMHLVVEPAHVEHVLVGNAKNYGKRTFGYKYMRTVVGNGLLTSDGTFWRRQRRIAQPAFRKPRIDAFGETMTRAAEDMVGGWKHGQTVDITREMMRVTLRVAGLTLLSRDVSGEADGVGHALTVALEQIRHRVTTPWAPPHWVPTPRNRRFRHALAELDRVVGAIVAERRAIPAEREDLLDLLMTATDPETGEGMSDEQLRDEVMTIFLAGHETTAMTLAWTFDLLARHPEVEARLRAEIDAALGGRSPTIADLANLPYAERVIFESMRLYPPAWALERSAAADDAIDGHRIRAGDWILISPWITHRRPDIWPDPERFDPDRFAPEASAGRPKYAYFPFAGGQRKCIGDRFALVEARLILAAVMQRARLEALTSAPPPPEPIVTLRPGADTPMRVSLVS